MYESKIDIAVLIIFFNRPEHVKKVFEQVRRARPSKLYLYQDGPRKDRPDDVNNVQKCRDVVSQIDWQCEVHTYYQKSNFGCDPSEYIAQKWMFEKEQMGIILEDDDVPSQSFFPFCKELLEKYKDDTRVNMICGMNNTDVSTHIQSSYFFTQKGSIWGWASWKRVIDTWDPQYEWLDDPRAIALIESQMNKYDFERYISTAKNHRVTGRAYYESINAASQFLNQRLNIVPKCNMICNIGIGQDTTHSTNDIRLLPKKIQKLLFMKTYEIEFPLTHPDQVVRDIHYEKKMSLTPFRVFCMRFEAAVRSFLFQDKKTFWNRVKKRLKIVAQTLMK